MEKFCQKLLGKLSPCTVRVGKDFSQYMPYLSAYMGHQTFRETCYYLHLMPKRLSRMGYMDISDIVPEVGYEQ